MSIEVKVVLEHKDAKLPTYAKEGDAGADIYCIEKDTDNSFNKSNFIPFYDERMNVKEVAPRDYVVGPGKTILIQTGLRIELPLGWEMQVRSRSGLAKRGLIVANSPGTIDSGYRGPCMVLLHNNTKHWRVIKPGTRIAQFVLKRAPQALFTQVEELGDSERGTGGFGSTGTK